MVTRSIGRVIATVRGQWIALFLASAMLGGCTGRPEGIVAVQPFDVGRYLGEWYEVMRLDHSFERGLTNVTATYTAREDGTVGVVNRGFDRTACRWRQVEGTAAFQGARDTASLSVTFFWPFAGGYHVFALDQRDYGWAMISGPSRDHLWILARRPDLPADIRDRLVEQARSLGFATEALILVDHSAPSCAAAG